MWLLCSWLRVKDIEIKNIDHLGIVAGIIDAIGLVEIINDLIGQESGEKVSAGHVVKAIILNGLGMVSQPLYMFPKFFENIACEHLIGPGVKAEYLNDDKLGRVMDKLFLKGLDEIFFTISLVAVKIFDISLKTSHLDSSSFHVHGEYKYSLPDIIFKSSGDFQCPGESEIKSLEAINITYCYSRDHRPDLKQFIMQLICSGDGDIPIFLKSASGNQVDSACFGAIAVEYQNQIQVDSLIVADCALYTEQNIKLMSNLKWLSRVPLTLKEAKFLVTTLPESEFIKSEISGYSYVEKDEQQDKYYQISADILKNEKTIDIETKSAGRFIIATNVLESKELSNDKTISEYKAQQSCERGFRFLKDPLFFADSIFLKSPERIEALAMIMGLCLLVYTLAQRQIRAVLLASKSTVKNQLGKSINYPTFRWIFQCFQSIHLVTYKQDTEVSNLTPDINFILTLLPENCRRYYNFVT